MYFACGIFAASFSPIPSSGGLIKSSAELIHKTGAVIVDEFRLRVVVARSVYVVEKIIGVGIARSCRQASYQHILPPRARVG